MFWDYQFRVDIGNINNWQGARTEGNGNAKGCTTPAGRGKVRNANLRATLYWCGTVEIFAINITEVKK